jgi:hypothetical protein
MDKHDVFTDEQVQCEDCKQHSAALPSSASTSVLVSARACVSHTALYGRIIRPTAARLYRLPRCS